MATERYPLSWPTGWKRTKNSDRRRAKFRGTKRVQYAGSANSYQQKTTLSVGDGTSRLADEMRRLGVLNGDWLISSNLRVRLDHLPYSDQRNPDDVGVAVYFRLHGKDRVLACDTWDRIADNLAAIAAHVEAIRAIERYSVGSLDQAFAGYQALPARGTTWRTTLGFAPDQAVDVDAVQEAYRRRARELHPDVPGGSHDAMASLNQARDEALAEARA